MSAVVNGTAIRQLERPQSGEESITEDDAKNPARVARLFVRLLSDVAALKRRFWPNRIDFEDVAVTGGSVLKLDHGFGGRVRWWVVDWIPTSATDPPIFERTSATDANTLTLAVGNPGTVTVRVEEAG